MSRRTPIRHILACILTSACLLAATAVSAYAAEESVLTPAELVGIDRSLDGTDVVIEGEAIGESLRAGDGHRWINVLGGGTAVGVWLTDEQAETVSVYGDHTHTGDAVRVEGTVNISCTQHGGEFDVHADSIDVLEPGTERTNSIELWKLGVGLAGLAIGFVEYRLWRVMRDRGPS